MEESRLGRGREGDVDVDVEECDPVGMGTGEGEGEGKGICKNVVTFALSAWQQACDDHTRQKGRQWSLWRYCRAFCTYGWRWFYFR